MGGGKEFHDNRHGGIDIREEMVQGSGVARIVGAFLFRAVCPLAGMSNHSVDDLFPKKEPAKEISVAGGWTGCTSGDSTTSRAEGVPEFDCPKNES